MMAKKKKTQSEEEEDRISHLPDHLICRILTHLSTKESVRTSLLASRWRNLWQCVPGLDLDSRKFSNLDAFVSFADRFFDMQRESCMHKLSLVTTYPRGKAFLLQWVDDAVTRRKIQYLDIAVVEFHKIPSVPLSLYTCETLVHVQLHQLFLVDSESFSLPCLKVMQLFFVRYRNEATLEKLISASPVLEHLRIMTSSSEIEKVLQVRSQSLKTISIDHDNTLVVIDAPRLQFLKTNLYGIKNYEIISPSFPAKVDINFAILRNVLDPNNTVFRDILTEISSVRDLAICGYYWKYMFPHQRPLIQFRYLSHLRVMLSASSPQVFPNLLESCPKLESLTVELCEEPKILFSMVPSCLVSSLKIVHLRSYVRDYGEEEVNLVRYFLKNSTILEKLSVRFYNIKKTSCDILKEQVLAMPICSATCEVIVENFL